MSYTIVDATHPEPSRATGPARTIALGLGAIALVAGLASERFMPQSSATGSRQNVAVATQMNARSSAGSLWFCPLVGDTTAGPGSVLISRSGSQNRSAQVALTIHSPSGVLAEMQRSLDSGSGLFAVLDLLPGAKAEDLPSLAATIEVDEPGVAVSVQIPGSTEPIPCSSVVSGEWWLGNGTTVLGSSTTLALYNPFPESALVDLEFLTDRGGARPTALQGLAIGPGSLRIVDLSEHVRRRTVIASKAVARLGRIVVGERMTVGKAATVFLGSPDLADSWFVANASFSDTRQENYVFINPSDDEITVAVTAILESGEVEPFAVSIPADGIAMFDPTEEQRIPEGSSYSMVATSPSRFLLSRSVRTPAGKKGSLLLSSPGAPRPSNRWIVDAITSAEERSLTILNPFDVPTKVTIERSGQTSGSKAAPLNLTVGAGKRLRVDVTPLLPADGSADQAPGGITVIVSSTDADVVVERGRASASNSTLGFPDADSSASRP